MIEFVEDDVAEQGRKRPTLWRARLGRQDDSIGHDHMGAQQLIVEVDGGYAVERATADARWDRALERAGFRVLRLSEELVVAAAGGGGAGAGGVDGVRHGARHLALGFESIHAMSSSAAARAS
ncbi:MAG TPA: DUF559 domain-containing protein, partial [Polyangiaceae bacterium]|nr:DUF559 domain-containing protein [Polyangiaceae bacterium]